MSFQQIQISTITSVYNIDARRGPQKIISLPSVRSTQGLFLNFKDAYGACTVSTFNLSTSKGDLFDNSVSSFTIVSSFGHLTLLNDGNSNWSLMDQYANILPNPFIGVNYTLSSKSPTLYNSGNLFVWLDASNPQDSTFTGSNNTVLRYWFDKSGNNNHVYSSPIANPVYFQVNPPLLNFFGAMSNFLPLSNSFSNQMTVFIVAKIINDGSCLFGFQYNGNLLVPNSANSFYLATSDSSSYGATSPFTLGQTYIYTVIYDGTNIALNSYGSNVITTPQVGTITKNIISIGKISLNLFYGNMHEVIMYNTNLLSTPVTQIEGYLAWKWGLQSNLVSYHPYKNAPP